MINWHHEPAPAALLSQLNASRVDRVKRVAIPADYYVYVGADDDARRIFTQLQDLRMVAIERALGCSFAEATSDPSRRDEVLALLEGLPEVSEVVEEVL